MLNISHRDRMEITGRGTVYVCSFEDNPDLTMGILSDYSYNLYPVTINDEQYIIRNIESARLLLDPPVQSDSFGLVVRKLEEI